MEHLSKHCLNFCLVTGDVSGPCCPTGSICFLPPFLDNRFPSSAFDCARFNFLFLCGEFCGWLNVPRLVDGYVWGCGFFSPDVTLGICELSRLSWPPIIFSVICECGEFCASETAPKYGSIGMFFLFRCYTEEFFLQCALSNNPIFSLHFISI